LSLQPRLSSTVTGTVTGSGTAVTNLNEVLCAVNTMGQQRYRIGVGEHNAWCQVGQTAGYSGTKFDWPGVAQRPQYRAWVFFSLP
jgi:hypothetical protein